MNLYRTLGRYAVPAFLRSLYFSLRYGCKVSFGADVQLTSHIRIGRGSEIRSFVRVITSEGDVTMGNNCAINSFTMIAGRNKPIAIGNHVRIGSHVCIVAGNHKFDDPNTLIVEQSIVDLGITIEDDVWLGSSSVVVDGVRIGRGSVIGAGSVVTKDIPPFSIAVGNPARVIRKRGEQKKET